MTLTIELTHEQELRLRRTAEARGVAPESLMGDLVSALPAPPQPGRVAALFARWGEENAARRAALTPEARADEDARAEEAQANIERGGLALRVPDLASHD